jgi:hypothetical protein
MYVVYKIWLNEGKIAKQKIISLRYIRVETTPLKKNPKGDGSTVDSGSNPHRHQHQLQ